MAKISVVIPTLNSEKYLEECLYSVFSQGHQDTEVIVQDGGSTDQTVAIARRYGAKVYQGNDRNEPDAINKALLNSHGDILAWLDGDDIYQPGALAAVNKAFRDRSIGWLYGKCKIIDGEGNETRSLITRIKEIAQYQNSVAMLKVVDYLPQPATFFRREMWEKVGLLNISEKLAFDYDYWLRMVRFGKPYFLNRYLASWRAHDGSLSVQNIHQEATDAYRVTAGFTTNPLLRVAQFACLNFTKAVYKWID